MLGSNLFPWLGVLVGIGAGLGAGLDAHDGMAPVHLGMEAPVASIEPATESAATSVGCSEELAASSPAVPWGLFARPDTTGLPSTWPQAFPSPPPGGQIAGVSQVPADQLRGTRGEGPYHIVFVTLPEGMLDGFHYYRDALSRADWEILEPLTHDGSRVGRPTIGFRGHGFAGDIRFEEALDMVLATIHLYTDTPSEADPRGR